MPTLGGMERFLQQRVQGRQILSACHHHGRDAGTADGITAGIGLHSCGDCRRSLGGHRVGIIRQAYVEKNIDADCARIMIPAMSAYSVITPATLSHY